MQVDPRCIGPRELVVVPVGVQVHALPELTLVGQAREILRRVARRPERREQEPDEQGDDGDDDQEFDERESGPGCPIPVASERHAVACVHACLAIGDWVTRSERRTARTPCM